MLPPKKSLITKRLDRRQFLKAAGMHAIVLPTILPGCARAGPRRQDPALRQNHHGRGLAGGMQGPSNTKSFLVEDDCHIVAACDLDTKGPSKSAVDTINEQYGNKDCSGLP